MVILDDNLMWTNVIATLFLIASVGVVFWAYLANEQRSRIRKEIIRLSGRQRIECHICAHIYEDVPQDGITQCPVCGSLLDRTVDIIKPAEPLPHHTKRKIKKLLDVLGIVFL